MHSFNKVRLLIAIAIPLASTAAGCSRDVPPAGIDAGSQLDADPGGGTLPQRLDPSGSYAMTSTFDLSTNLPGTVGLVVNDVIAATSGPDQPTQWILDQIIAAMGGGTLASLLQGAEPFVVGYLNARLLGIAPDFVTSIVHVGDDFGQIARQFGLDETLEVATAGTDYSAVHTAVGVHFKIDVQETDLAFAMFQLSNVVASSIGVTLAADGTLCIAEHQLPLSYGKLLRIGLDSLILPTIDPNAHDLGTLFADKIDCVAVGSAIEDALVDHVGFGGGAEVWQTACAVGLQFAAQAIYQKVLDIDASVLELDITGTAHVSDPNHDDEVDALAGGTWAGTVRYSGTPAPLAAATFTGTRM